MLTLLFEFETSNAHLDNVEDQILLTVAQNGVRIAANLSTREVLGGASGPNQPYRVTLIGPVSLLVIDRIAASLPRGVRVQLEP